MGIWSWKMLWFLGKICLEDSYQLQKMGKSKSKEILKLHMQQWCKSEDIFHALSQKSMLQRLQLQLVILFLDVNSKMQQKKKSKLWIINYSNKKLLKELLNIMLLLLLEITLENFVLWILSLSKKKKILVSWMKLMHVYVWENHSLVRLSMMEWKYVERLVEVMDSLIILDSLHWLINTQLIWHTKAKIQYYIYKFQDIWWKVINSSWSRRLLLMRV